MENATKALLISAGIIIGVLLLSLFTYMYSNTISMQDAYETQQEINRRNQINTKFLKYNGQTEITAQEIVSIINLAQEYQNTDDIDITIIVKFNDGTTETLSNATTNDKISFIKEKGTGIKSDGTTTYIKHYKATVTIGENGIVNSVIFEEQAES